MSSSPISSPRSRDEAESACRLELTGTDADTDQAPAQEASKFAETGGDESNPDRHSASEHPSGDHVDFAFSPNGRAGVDNPAHPSTASPNDGPDASPTSDGPTAEHGTAAATPGTTPESPPRKRGLIERGEAFLARLSTRNNFWHRFCSWIWLPFAFRSGIRMRKDGQTISAVLPFRRFNRNWYDAMAGAALLGNSEIAGGMHVFKACGGNHRVVCKQLEYKFLRPCVGPAMYRVTPTEDIDTLVKSGKEFNITVEMEIVQVMRSPNEQERRVGRCTATFHATPISLHKEKLRRKREHRKRMQAKGG